MRMLAYLSSLDKHAVPVNKFGSVVKDVRVSYWQLTIAAALKMSFGVWPPRID